MLHSMAIDKVFHALLIANYVLVQFIQLTVRKQNQTEMQCECLMIVFYVLGFNPPGKSYKLKHCVSLAVCTWCLAEIIPGITYTFQPSMAPHALLSV